MRGKVEQKMGEIIYRNIFKCECGNHQSFTSLEKIDIDSTWVTNCNYCLKRKTLVFVTSEVQI